MGNLFSYLQSPEESFWNSAKNGELPTVENCLRRAAETNGGPLKLLEWYHPIEGTNCLMAACETGQMGCVQELIRAGASLNDQSRDARGFTALHYAVKFGQFEIVRYLLLLEAVDPFVVSTGGRTALDLARNTLEKSRSHNLVRIVLELEKKLCIYKSWLYESTENIISKAAGLKSLDSWSRRQCFVLRTGVANCFELNFFGKNREDSDFLPVSQKWFHASQTVVPTEKSKWFNSKPFSFVLKCKIKSNNSSLALGQIGCYEFAALCEQDFLAWVEFLTSINPDMYSPERASSSTLESSLLSTVISAPPAYSMDSSPSAPMASISSEGTPGPFCDAGVDSDFEFALKLSQQLNGTIETDHDFVRHRTSTDSSTRDGEQDEAKEENFASTACCSHDEQQQSDSLQEESECIICFDSARETVCVPCGHNAICSLCATDLMSSTRACPICREHVREVIKIFHV